jgi:hypothetical protein
MNFEAQIRAFEHKANLGMNTSVCKAFEYLGTELVTLTGYKNINYGGFSNGDIANNWHVSIGQVVVPVPNGPDLTGSESLMRIRGVQHLSLFYTKDNTIYLTNAMGYSYRADKLGWPAEESTNGWKWSGKVKAYGFTGKAINNLKGKYI